MALTYDNGILVWPDHIKPQSITMGVTQPTNTSRAQNGKKYVRSFNYAKHGLTVTYPPMSAEDFQSFYAAIMALKGDYGLCWFNVLGTDGEKILFPFFGNDTIAPLANTTYTVGTGALITDVVLKNLPVSTVEPIPAGSVISGLGRNFGHVQTVIACTDSDIGGLATITLAHPLVETVTVNDPVDVDPTRVMVSLGDDTFQTNIQTIKYYGFSIDFEFDRLY